MPATLPPVYRRMAMSQHSDDGTILLITIDHEELTSPIRLVADHGEVVSNGDTYLPAQFKIIRPRPAADGGYTPSEIEISIVDQQVTAAVRSVITEATINMQEVMISDPDEVVASYDFKLSGDLVFDARTLSAPLIFDQVLEEPMPPKIMSPALAPGLFGG